MSATAVLGAVDALGKIIGEPIKAISQAMAEKSRMKMQMQKEKHDLDLEAKRVKTELEKNREIAKIDADVRRWHEEINDYIAQKEIERNKKIMDAIKEYQENMTRDYVAVMSNIGALDIRLTDKAHRFVIARTEEYMQLQTKAWEQYKTELTWAKKQFPDNREMQREIAETAQTQRTATINSSQKCITLLNEDLSRINAANTDRITSAKEYIERIFSNWAQVTGVSALSSFQSGNYIEQKNKALLK